MRDKKIYSYRISRIKRLLKELVVNAEKTPSDTRCIICGSKRVNVCTYCFIESASEIIKGTTGNGKLLTEFGEDFNKEIWVHPGTSCENIKYL